MTVHTQHQQWKFHIIYITMIFKHMYFGTNGFSQLAFYVNGDFILFINENFACENGTLHSVSNLKFQRLTSHVSITFIMIMCGLYLVSYLNILVVHFVNDLGASKQCISNMFLS